MNLTSPITDYPTARRFLLELKSTGVSLGLGRMERLMAALGHPERSLPLLHVAGTNGKGSVSAMLEAMLRQAGWRTGLYTSPHLVRLGERVQVNRDPLSEGEIVANVSLLREALKGLAHEAEEESRPSYFECMTAIALLHFARSRCDIAIIEVGVGGRLDATNVITPEVSVITSIGLDHCDLLGETLAEIAMEKAGIIKPGRPTVIGYLPREAEDVIRHVAAARGAPVISVAEHFGADGENHPLPLTNLAGAYQRRNAATAVLVARLLPDRWKLSDTSIAGALLNVDWPARLQRFAVSDKVVVLDSSHNAEGAAELEANLEDLTREFGRRPIVVTGVLGLARAKPLIRAICQHSSEIHFVRPDQRRACTFEELESAVPSAYAGRLMRDTVETLFPGPSVANVGAAGDVIVVTGSIYLAGEVLARLDPKWGPYEGDLQDF
ncbi:MAG: folylpolyglutamate synthase/dihydrofolate synthase family protein [Opitutus sp.]